MLGESALVADGEKVVFLEHQSFLALKSMQRHLPRHHERVFLRVPVVDSWVEGGTGEASSGVEERVGGRVPV
jgi:hypothetical protein